MKLKIADKLTKSFFPHDSLNSSIFDKDQKMTPAVQQAIVLVVEEFLDTIQYDITMDDIESVILTGSLANYSYNEWSDVDLHLLVDYSKFDEDKKFVRDYLRSKAVNWNDRHKVTIYGHEIEIYFQDVDEVHHSTGVYDITKDQWFIKPKKTDNKDSIDENLPLAFNKANYISIEIDKLASKQNDRTIEKIDVLKDKIKKMRQSGLERDGEYSIENMAFKILRRRGDLKLLHQAARMFYDKNLSIPKLLDEDQEWWKRRRKLDNKNYRELIGHGSKKSTFKRKYASKNTGYPKGADRKKISKKGTPFIKNPNLKLGISAPPGVGE
jgi:predicted nucleotidyltransferase